MAFSQCSVYVSLFVHDLLILSVFLLLHDLFICSVLLINNFQVDSWFLSRQLTEAEEHRRVRRKEQNRRAAKRFRQNKKFRESILLEVSNSVPLRLPHPTPTQLPVPPISRFSPTRSLDYYIIMGQNAKEVVKKTACLIGLQRVRGFSSQSSSMLLHAQRDQKDY